MANRLVCVGVAARQCDWCGSTFEPGVYNEKACSPECRLERQRDIARRNSRSRRAAKGPAPIIMIPCSVCGALVRKRNGHTKTCSKACFKAQWTRPSRAVRGQKLAVEQRVCARCEQFFTPTSYQSTYCTPACRTDARRDMANGRRVPRRDPNAKGECRECGAIFARRDANQWSCSVACCTRYWARVNARTRRARMFRAEYEVFDPIEVLDRDGWRCHLCGIKTPKRLRGTKARNAPELDHIIPLAAGGAHTRLNTACACAHCNRTKSDRPLGQIRLFA